jgi:hypothetical protein
MTRRLVTSLALVVLVVAPSAAAAPPPNDSRANATRLGDPPVTVSGNTAGATAEAADPSTYCGRTDGTLWYRLAGVGSGRLVLRMTAAGDLDASVAVFRVVRSRLSLQACAPTDDKGRAALTFNVAEDATYLIEIGRLRNSADDRFTFKIFRPEPSSRPPGKPLPPRGVSSSVDPLVDFDDAFSVRLQPGIPYRFNLAPARGGCVGVALYRPGTRSFSASRPLHTLRCGGYFTLTPGPGGGGRYTLLVTANGARAGAQRYHLAAGAAGPDDTAPGRTLGNLSTRRGSLNARGLDVVDLYRFDVGTRSDVTLRLRAPGSASFDLLLIGETGRRLGCECGSSGSRRLTKQLSPGHYFAVVRAREFSHGAYGLSLLVRQITATQVTFGGAGTAGASPGQAVAVTAHVAGATAGRVTIRVERFDPLMGWQFARRYRLRVSRGGAASATFVPRTVGRWRARAFYSGTRTTSPSKSGFAILVVR